MGAAHPVPGRRPRTVATLTDEGFAALDAAAPGHIEAVRAFVIDALDAGQPARFGILWLGRICRVHGVMVTSPGRSVS